MLFVGSRFKFLFVKSKDYLIETFFLLILLAVVRGLYFGSEFFDNEEEIRLARGFELWFAIAD